MKRHSKLLGRQRGFTLLEAIVAVAVLGIALMPLLSFISQAALELRIASDTNARSLAEQNVLAFLETLNPMLEPEGEVELGELRVTWTSREAVPVTQRAPVGTGMPGFVLGFYDVSVSVAHDRALWFDIAVRKIGYNWTLKDPF